MKLTITRIKPNPAGKDRPPHGGPTPAQLAAEWVDFRNDQGQAVSLNGISLWHLTYAPGRDAEWARIMTFSEFTLANGKIVRVHSGIKRDLSVVRQEDLDGADYHAFTGDDAYVWNNKQGDTPLLFRATDKTTIDNASYDPNPPEGVVLVRVGDKLVVPVSRAANW
jgi:hypothetical protein